MSRRGITLVEALVCCVIVAMLIALFLPAVGTRGDRNRNLAQCTRNLRDLGTALSVYAAANGDRLPATTTPSDASWLCDQPRDTAGLIVNVLLTSRSLSLPEARKLLYCPANRDQDASALWGGAAAYAVTGYTWLNDRSVSPGSAFPAVSVPRAGGPSLAYRSKLTGVPNPRQAELAADWILSDPTITPPKSRWSGLTFHGRPGIYTTSHLDTAGQPQGANVLGVDGRVEWRSFTARTAASVLQPPVPPATSGPHFWVPAL